MLLWRGLRRFLRRVPVDLVHAHRYEGLPTAYAATRFRGGPIIYDAHTLLNSEFSYYSLGLPHRLKKFIGNEPDQRVPRLANHVIAVTDQIKLQLCGEGNLDPRNISVVPNSVELEFFHQEMKGCDVPAIGERLVVYAGTFAAYQGIELLLQAFAQLLHAQPSCRLRFVTDSSFQPYERLARELGIRERIETVGGAFAERPKQLRRADVSVNPRVNCDGLPQKLLNYMAAGKPVVSFASSAKTIEHEKNGLVVQDGDAGGFAAAMGAGALVTARALSWDVVAQRIEGVYHKVLNDVPGS